MIKLIKIELKKIFHKKGIYIIWLLLLIFCLINNVLYKTDYDNEGYYINDYKKDITSEIKLLEEKLNNNSKENIIEYISLKTKIDLLKIKNKYNNKSWQYNKVDYLENDIYNINYYTYVNYDIELLNQYQTNYNDKIEKFNTNDWKYFINLEIEQETDSNKLEILKLRLEKDIPYGVNYLNDALISYSDNKVLLSTYKNISKLNYEEQIEYNQIISNYNIDKYIIENKINLKKQNNLNYLLRTIIEDYQLFIIITIMLVAGSIVSEEFNKGTIKLLLIKPFSRSKILLSKYLTSILVLLITIILTILFELIIGGYLFGFDSLTMQVVTYNINNNILVNYNIFVYMIIRIIYNLPLLIMILTICFGISCITCNTVISVTLTMLIYMFSQTINSLISRSNIEMFKYFLTINWNFTYYLFGGIGINKYGGIGLSSIVYIIHLILFLIIIFTFFRKKDIKNI